MLDRIIAPVRTHIERFEDRLRQSMDSDVALVREMGSHLQENPGRRFRPALALLSAQAVGECSDRVIDAAVGIEIIQTATLVHDDVIDSAELRRGAEVLNAQWGNQAAVLMGDFLLASALEVLVGIQSMDVMAAATRAVRRMIEGEILEVQSGTDVETDLYFSVIDKKTASLMALSCELGAILGGGTPEQIGRMSQYGKEVGIAFQITDDLLDFIGDEQMLGKPVGSDVREKKLTLPLIRALINCGNGEAERIHAKVRSGVATEEDWQDISRFVHQYHGIEEAQAEARSYAQAAVKNLGPLRVSEARDALELAAMHVVERNQ